MYSTRNMMKHKIITYYVFIDLYVYNCLQTESGRERACTVNRGNGCVAVNSQALLCRRRAPARPNAFKCTHFAPTFHCQTK